MGNSRTGGVGAPNGVGAPDFDAVDKNMDGVIDRSEFERNALTHPKNKPLKPISGPLNRNPITLTLIL